MDRFGAVAEALAQSHIWAKGRAHRRHPPAAEAEYAAATRAGLTYVTWDDPRYPEPLRAIEDAPPLLLVKGDAAVLGQPLIAIVGARNASVNGRKFANMLAAAMAKAGVTVISGMARGIDGAAHDGALAHGKTIAVLAGGTDVIYPPEHASLYERIAASGAVISEMPPGTAPQAALFPRRNRIISGASRGVVVVEAALRSGSLITARMAADQGREVFAVPGSPLDPRAHGPNGLIREGATLIQSADDVLAALTPVSTNFSKTPGPSAQLIEISEKTHISTRRAEVEAALGHHPRPC